MPCCCWSGDSLCVCAWTWLEDTLNISDIPYVYSSDSNLTSEQLFNASYFSVHMFFLAAFRQYLSAKIFVVKLRAWMIKSVNNVCKLRICERKLYNVYQYGGYCSKTFGVKIPSGYGNNNKMLRRSIFGTPSTRCFIKNCTLLFLCIKNKPLTAKLWNLAGKKICDVPVFIIQEINISLNILCTRWRLITSYVICCHRARDTVQLLTRETPDFIPRLTVWI